jgi:hypothetical protein
MVHEACGNASPDAACTVARFPQLDGDPIVAVGF